MAFEEPLERAYPYRTGWKVLGCTGLFFAAVGAGGTLLVPVCCEQWQNGNVAFGALVIFGAPCTALTILLAVLAFVSAAREAVRPPLVRVTPTALRLPEDARGHPLEKDEQGNLRFDGPRVHPEEIPFTAIRWARREAATADGDDRLLIVHSLSTATLELHQSMMQPADFDELETVLRAAVPEAFAALPVPQAPPPTDAD